MPDGYAGKILRVDLTNERLSEESLEELDMRKYLGGTCLGAKYLNEEIGPGVEWSDAENRLMWMTGPLNGTRVGGSGIVSILTKGPMTNLAASSQANGFFGAYLKFSGFDGIIIEGKALKWTYLYIHDGTAELRQATHLMGKNTSATENAIKEQLGVTCSVHSIGPAGENLVRFACIVGDGGHVASKNGVGAVMGAKKLKAIALARGKHAPQLYDRAGLSDAARALFESVDRYWGGDFQKWGTLGTYSRYYRSSRLPVRNYMTNIFPEHERFDGRYIRTHFESKPTPCWACRFTHCRTTRVTEGPFKGFVGKEPQYEGITAMSSVIGQLDPGTAVVLADMIDQLGLDINESGWVLGWLMECYEKGLLTKADLDGVEMDWGNVEAVAVMLQKIAHRQGVGDRLAEGVKRAAEYVGGEALNYAIYTQKGATPRGHDDRAYWHELLDTSLANTGTIESSGGNVIPEQLGVESLNPDNKFDPKAESTFNARVNGRRMFEDSLVVCRFCTCDIVRTNECVKAATGWDFDLNEAMDVGRRAINQLRVFNFRHGLTKEMEAPSARYGSAPVDGVAKRISVMPNWDFIRRNYYQEMGWDPETGKPLPQTLKKLKLDKLIRFLS